MIYINTLSDDACVNFGCEYYFAVEKKLPEDVFMLWNTSPTLMIGKYQNTAEEIDVAYAASRGINVVRRMSGGGTIYTDNGGWQFTYITGDGGGDIDFERFVSPVTEALCALGLDARRTGRNDIMLCTNDGVCMKISGNTQFKKRGVTVHHGSLLFDVDLEELARTSTPKPYKITSKAIKSVRERVTNIRSQLERDMSGEQFRDYLVKYLAGDAREYRLTSDDIGRINELAAELFGNPESVFGADPKFELHREIHTSGGAVELGFTVKNGRIIEFGIRGDFFALDGLAEAEKSFVGLPFTENGIREAVTRLCGKLYGAAPDEIIRGIF